jgi:hypothetical protein
MTMTRLLCAPTIIALLLASTTPSSAQREGGAFFGPFSRGNSSGGDFSGPPNCTWGKEYCAKTQQPKAPRTTGKKGR